MDLLTAAIDVRRHAHAPYSRFAVGAAVRAPSGKIYAGCNVENVSYPEGICAETAAIAAMVAAGESRIAEILVVGDSPAPVPPCGGCRQRIAEFAGPETTVILCTTDGQRRAVTMADLLPGAFNAGHMSQS